MSTAIALRDYQEDTLAEVNRQLMLGNDRQLIVIPTGGGKTVIFATGISRRLANNPRGLPTLVLAHRDELISQAVETRR